MMKKPDPKANVTSPAVRKIGFTNSVVRSDWLAPSNGKKTFDGLQCPRNSSDRTDKSAICPICSLSSRTGLSDVSSGTMYALQDVHR